MNLVRRMGEMVGACGVQRMQSPVLQRSARNRLVTSISLHNEAARYTLMLTVKHCEGHLRAHLLTCSIKLCPI